MILPGTMVILCLGGGFRLVEEHLAKSSLPPVAGGWLCIVRRGCLPGSEEKTLGVSQALCCMEQGGLRFLAGMWGASSRIHSRVREHPGTAPVPSQKFSK